MESSNPLISPEKEVSNPRLTERSNQEIKEENNKEISRLHDDLKNKLETNTLESSPETQSERQERRNEEVTELHQKLIQKLEMSESEGSELSEEAYRNQEENLEEEFKFEDLDNIPDITLVQKYKKMWNQLAMGPITKSARNKLLALLAKIDEKLQTIEKRELDKHFGGAYEQYNYILRRFYEKLLNEKTNQAKNLEGNLHQAQQELKKLEEELEKVEKQNEELRNTQLEEFRKIDKELETVRQDLFDRNKANGELLKSIEDLNRENETIKNERVQLEQELKEKQEELLKSTLLATELEVERKKIEGRFAITLEKYEEIKNTDGDLETRNNQLTKAINELQTSRDILHTYEEREEYLKVELEETKRGLVDKTREIEALQTKQEAEFEKLTETIKKFEAENTILKQQEETLRKNLQIQEDEFQKKYKEIEDKKEKIEQLRKFCEQETERLRAQREGLEKRQEELDRLKAIDRGLEIHKEEIRKLIEENNFKKEQVLKAIQDLASKGEKLEEDKKKFELKVQEQTSSLKGERDIRKREESGSKDYDTLPVCLGFLGGIIIALIGCWFAFGLVGRDMIKI